MIKLNIKALVFFLAFLPMLLITVILSIYFLSNQLNDIDEGIKDKGNSLARHLATASEFGVFSGNSDNLNNILQQLISEDNNIVSIYITDHNGQTLASTISTINDSSPVSEIPSKLRSFRYPIRLYTTEISGVDEFSPNPAPAGNDNIIGWIDVSLSTVQILKRRNQIIRDSVLIIFVGLIASVLLSLWMGKSLTRPIIRLTQAVNSVKNGKLDETIETTSSGEIGMLERGFMSMLGKIRLSQKDLQDKIDKTTLGLKNSLKIVEKQNLELTQARSKALEASKAKSRFLANISHEIRTPMNGILGFARLLKKSNLTDEQYDYLDTIEKSSNNLLSLIEDILDITRVEEGKIVIKKLSFKLRDCIEDTIMLMAPEALGKGIDITYFYYRDVPATITAPYERIRQILINYIGNAIKFSETGTIIVRVMLDPDTANSVRISVSDQGIGIPESEKEHLFIPFAQIDDTSTRKYGGSGLGLAISKSIARAIGGDVGLENNSDRGSTFWFSFPYQENDTIIYSSSANPAPHPVPVFLYDSNPDTRRSIYAHIREAGFTINDYSDPGEMEGILRSHTGKAICVLSLSHKEISDTNTERLIKELSTFPDKRLLLLVSSIDSSDKDNARDCGADACITKPYRYEEISKILTSLSQFSEDESTSTISPSPSQTIEQTLKGINILLAEDNAINTKLIQTVLGETGAIITHANNGEEAINFYNQNDFDIILMDIQMPKMNGLDATIYIRNSQSPNNAVPIIGMTANALAEDIAVYIKSGFNDILIKPIAIDDLFLEIQRWINERNQPSNTESNTDKIKSEDIDRELPEGNPNMSPLGISEKLSDDLYKMLIDELPGIKEHLKEFFSAQDWESLRKQIHKLLGGISYCNVPGLKEKTITFQNSLRNRSASLPSDFEALIDEIEKIT